jgi:methionine salvage enolase-phosphatase E1
MMSAFVLRRFADLVGEGVKTDKGFEEVHVNSVARQVSEFSGQEVTSTQVYKHMCKWCQRWVKVCKLKELSGVLWDEDICSIFLAEELLLGYTKVSYNIAHCNPLLSFID